MLALWLTISNIFDSCKAQHVFFSDSFSSDALEVDISPVAINQTAERLMRDYGNMIFRYAYTFMHNKEDAEDVLQDTLIQFIKTAPKFANGLHEKAWLLRVAGNICKNKLQAKKNHGEDELSDNLASQENQDLSFVWDAVKQLDSKYREVVHLFYYEQLSTAQIAQVLNKNESTVRSLLKRGREQLKDILKEVYDFE